jgi:hypothetical protein
VTSPKVSRPRTIGNSGSGLLMILSLPVPEGGFDRCSGGGVLSDGERELVAAE